MRFSVFLALLVATFVVSCISFTSAENVALINNEAPESNTKVIDATNEVRRLRVSGTDEEERSKVEIAAKFVSSLKEKAILTKAAKMTAGANQAAKLSDDQVVKLAKLVADSAKKDAKSWPRLKKALKITLGVGASAAVLYAAYKLLTGNSASTTAFTASTMTVSA